MLFLDEIRKVPRETPVPQDPRNRLKRVLKEKRRRTSSEQENRIHAAKQFIGRICRIDEQV